MQFDTPFDRGIPAIGDDANALPRSNYYGEPSNGLTRFRNERHQLTGLAQLGGGWTLNGGIVWRTVRSRLFGGPVAHRRHPGLAPAPVARFRDRRSGRAA